MRKITLFVTLIILVLLVSCKSATQDTNVSTSSTRTPITLTATESPTNTPVPTSTATELPYPTPPSIATSYNVPAWLGNSDDTVIMTITDVTVNSNQLTFFNANTQERFDISLPTANLSHFFWTSDGKSFGFLSRDRTTFYIVNTNTGITSEYSITEKASICLQAYFNKRGPENEFLLSKMWVYDTSPESEIFTCEPTLCYSSPEIIIPSEFSSPIAWSHNSNLFVVQSLRDEDQGLPCIINTNGEVIKCMTEIDPQYYRIGLDLFRWSKDDKQIYYTQDRGIFGTDLCIYDVASSTISCPTENVSELDRYNIEIYSVSDNERFFHILYGSSCNECDYWGDPSSFIIRRDGADILFMGEELREPITYSPYPFFPSLFRPGQ